MMRTVLTLVAVLGTALIHVETADACGTKLTVKATKVGRNVERSSNPSSVLVLASDSKRLSSRLKEAGHTVETASSPDEAPARDYRVVVVDPGQEAQAQTRYPNAQVVTRTDNTKDSLARVEAGVSREGRVMARRPTGTARRQATAFGPRADERQPTAFGPRPDEIAASPEPTPAATAATPTPPAEAVEPARPTASDEPTEAVATTTVTPRRPRRDEPAAEPRPAPAEPSERSTRGAKVARTVNFGGGSSELSDAFRSRLDATARWLAANPDRSITVEGHASRVGPAEVNQPLSQARADAVKDYLVSQGVDAGRIQTAAFGFDRPAFQPPSSGRNRRVNIIVNP